jgi:hypothetical protein
MSFPRPLPIALCAALFVACSSATNKPGPPPDCPSCHSATTIGGVESSSGGVGGSGGNGAGGEGQGGGETTTVSGKVVVVNSPAFDSAAAYAKAAVVYGEDPSGKELSEPYDGTSFTIDGVAKGDTWFLVVPNDTTDAAYPTYSLQPVADDKLTLPLLDQQVLSEIALDAGVALSSSEAQIVLRVTDTKNNPLQGITATSAGAGLILYDFGPASYSVQNKATGERGMIVILNQSSASITLTDAAAHVYHVDVRTEAGSATFLDLTL